MMPTLPCQSAASFVSSSCVYASVWVGMKCFAQWNYSTWGKLRANVNSVKLSHLRFSAPCQKTRLIPRNAGESKSHRHHQQLTTCCSVCCRIAAQSVSAAPQPLPQSPEKIPAKLRHGLESIVYRLAFFWEQDWMQPTSQQAYITPIYPPKGQRQPSSTTLKVLLTPGPSKKKAHYNNSHTLNNHFNLCSERTTDNLENIFMLIFVSLVTVLLFSSAAFYPANRNLTLGLEFN